MDGFLDAQANYAIRVQISELQEQLATDRTANRKDMITVGVDSPVYFDFETFVTRIFTEVLGRESERNPNLRNYVGTLQLRLAQAQHDPRYAFLFRVPPFKQALCVRFYVSCSD